MIKIYGDFSQDQSEAFYDRATLSKIRHTLKVQGDFSFDFRARLFKLFAGPFLTIAF